MTTPNDTAAGTAPGAVVGGYAGEWALFVDWCAATGAVALPAEAETVEAFLRACPAAPATLARRVTAIDRHHRAAGQLSPRRTETIRDLARGRPAQPVRKPFDPGAVDAALRTLPIVGWTAGWFGRRDRALLVLAAAGLPYRQIAQLTGADLELINGAVTIPSARVDGPVIIAAGEDPAVCRACALGRWLRILNLDAANGIKTVVEVLQRQKQHPTAPTHICRRPQPVAPQAAPLPLLPPIDPHGSTHIDQPAPLTRQSISDLARKAAAGRHATHKIAPLSAGTTTAADQLVVAAPAAYSVEQYQRGLQQRAADRGHLAELCESLSEIDARIAALEARTKALLAGSGGL